MPDDAAASVLLSALFSVLAFARSPSGSAESFGLAALEAMAMKIPVISTNTGGLPEVNINEVTGYLSDVGDVEDMANNAIKLLSDEKLLSKFKANAYEQAKKFDINNVLPLYEKLYQKVIAKELV